MAEQSQENGRDLDAQSAGDRPGDELDAAGKSLSEALRISFIILKIIMIVLIILFFASGFRTVGPDEQAIVLRFGRIKPVGEERVLGPGPHWVFPYPIDQIVKIPVEKRVNLAINSFWYFQTKEEILDEGPKKRRRPPQELNPVKDGYCITRSGKRSRIAADSGGSDYNIVHTKWQLIYQIEKPEEFFKSVYVEDVKPGQSYFDVITESITPLLENLIEDAIVTTMVNYTVDEAIYSQARIPAQVKKLLQEKLDGTGSGIRVVSVQLTRSTWPRQIDKAFEDFISASQASQTAIGEARTYAEETLNETAGPVAEGLFEVIKGKAVSEQEEQYLWEHLAGAAREEIALARAYRTEVAETAEADAKYLQQILPEYRKRPKLVLQRIYLDALEYILNNADEKFIIQPAKDTKGREIRVLINRNPAIKPKFGER